MTYLPICFRGQILSWVNNLRINSFQKANEDLTLGGTIDVPKNEDRSGAGAEAETKTESSWKNVPAIISITNHGTNLIITFDKNSPISQTFANFPVLGIVTTKS
jgi:hypothetical protein